jgi:hypothetical protein
MLLEDPKERLASHFFGGIPQVNIMQTHRHGIRRRTRTSLRHLHRHVKLRFDENLSPRLVGAVANLLRANVLLLKAFSLDPVEALLSLQA